MVGKRINLFNRLNILRTIATACPWLRWLVANIKGILERPQERREDAMHTCITHENLKYSLEDANYFRYLMVWGFHKSKKAMMKCMNRNRHTPDAEWTIVGSSPLSKTYHSKKTFLDEVIDPFNARMSTPLVPTVRGIYADGDTVIILFDAEATARDGKPYHNTYTWYFHLYLVFSNEGRTDCPQHPSVFVRMV